MLERLRRLWKAKLQNLAALDLEALRAIRDAALGRLIAGASPELLARIAGLLVERFMLQQSRDVLMEIAQGKEWEFSVRYPQGRVALKVVRDGLPMEVWSTDAPPERLNA